MLLNPHQVLLKEGLDFLLWTLAPQPQTLLVYKSSAIIIFTKIAFSRRNSLTKTLPFMDSHGIIFETMCRRRALVMDPRVQRIFGEIFLLKNLEHNSGSRFMIRAGLPL